MFYYNLSFFWRYSSLRSIICMFGEPCLCKVKIMTGVINFHFSELLRACSFSVYLRVLVAHYQVLLLGRTCERHEISKLGRLDCQSKYVFCNKRVTDKVHIPIHVRQGCARCHRAKWSPESGFTALRFFLPKNTTCLTEYVNF